jgi:hypothetical protein
MNMIYQDRPVPDTAFPDSIMGISGGIPSILTNHLRVKVRFTRTLTLLKQCAWCGAVEIGGRFYLHHRISARGRVFQVQLFSWLQITVGISHGLCSSCADGIKRQHGTFRNGTSSS